MTSARAALRIARNDVTEQEPPTDPGDSPASGEPASAEGPTATGASTPPDEQARSISRKRLIGVDILIAVTTLLAVVGMLAVWANRLLFNPDNWSSTSTKLLQNAAIRNAAANYVVDQLYANVNVAGVIKSGLPPRFQPLAGPAAGALRNAAVQGTELALERPRVQTLWARANRAADKTFIAIVNGGKGPVGTNKGEVTLNLGAIVQDAASRFGLPGDIASKIPPNAANLTIFKSNQLKFIQNVGNAVRSLALWLTIFVPLLYLLAIVLARGHRRRTLMSVGIALAVAGIVGLAGRAILKTQIASSVVSDESLRPAAEAVVSISTEILNSIAGAFVAVGLVLVAAAWFAGPARPAVVLRRAIAPFMRERPAWAFAIVFAVMVLVFIWQPIHSTGTPAGIIVYLALAMAGTEALRRQTIKEFPDAQLGDATAAMRAWIHRLRSGRQHGPAAANPGPGNPGTGNPGHGAPQSLSLTEQLERLAALRDGGAITPEEYAAAKANLLHV
jgi:hypothetical protein